MSVAFSQTGGSGVALRQSPTVKEPSVRAESLFDRTAELLKAGGVREGMDFLAGGLGEMRSVLLPEDWERICRTCVDHPLAPIVWQDPFTLHSFRKPRGYAGDAQLLDYIYRVTPPGNDTSALGAAVFNYMMGCLGARSVRSRAQILAEIIDQTAKTIESPRVLSVACGHLREASHSVALREGRVGEFIALDQDGGSLGEVARSVGPRVRTVQNSVRSLLAGKTDLGQFHLVYASGLYDYLSDRVASRLTRILFNMVAPGGRLVVANFATPLPEAGYMETFMGWKLIYRTSEEMNALSEEIPADEWKSHRLFWDEHESVLFLDMVRRSAVRPKMLIAKRNGYTIPGLRNVQLARGLAGARRGESPSNGESTNGHPEPDGC